MFLLSTRLSLERSSQMRNALECVPVIVTVAQWMTVDRSRKLYAKVWNRRRRAECEQITINCTTKHKRILQSRGKK